MPEAPVTRTRVSEGRSGRASRLPCWRTTVFHQRPSFFFQPRDAQARLSCVQVRCRRARNPDQKARRRQELLEAARRLMRSHGLEEVGLSAIAREAGVVKSNVYRYFGSREEILLEVLGEDAGAWLADFERATAELDGSDDITAVAAAIARTVAARPLTCELIAVVAGVLERNASREAA